MVGVVRPRSIVIGTGLVVMAMLIGACVGGETTDQESRPGVPPPVGSSALTGTATETPDGSGEQAGETAGPVGPATCPVRSRRINFASGAVSQTVSGRLGPGGQDHHVLTVADGQIMSVELAAEDGLSFFVNDPAGQIIEGQIIEGRGAGFAVETVAGDYGICVAADPSAVSDASEYDLTVTAVFDDGQNPVDASWCGDTVNDRGAIRFGVGDVSAVVDDTVVRGERDRYTFDAAADQRLVTEISSAENNAVFAIRTPEGAIQVADATDFRTSLAAGGTYEVCIGGIRGNTNYEFYLEIS